MERRLTKGVLNITAFGNLEQGSLFRRAVRVLEELRKNYSFEIQLPEQDAGEIDIALCLETSETEDARAAIERFMEAGTVTFVPRTLTYEELPDDSVVKVDTDIYGEALLRAYLEKMIGDESLRARVGENARKFILERRENGRGSSSQDIFGGKQPETHDATSPTSAQGEGGRFIKLDGMDFKRGAIEYPRKLNEGDRQHLFTKPFYDLANKVSRWSHAGLDDDAHRQFCDFANMARLLALPAGARILDVGCGSGWLSEYFARLGYYVTGVDISPDLIEIAQERLHSVPSSLKNSVPLKCRFVAHDIESAPLEAEFDVVICYDSLHHFEDERAVLRNLAAMLPFGGLLFVLEGERPPQDSETARELLGVMREYETLESPFSRDYLLRVLREHGFAIAGDYISVNDLVERDCVETGGRLHIETESAFNYLLCKKVGPNLDALNLKDSRAPGQLRARFRLRGEWRERVFRGERLRCEFEVENSGDTLWLTSRHALRGTVRLAARILDEEGAIVDEVHGVPPLELPVAPNESVALSFERRAPDATGSYTLKIDLIDQGICWFEGENSEPLVLQFQVQD
ncbi:MAG: hypothetical protein AUG51_05535 [Acidobacteria bacterium 13_1_20CM_3_53_8]|nr:MAG: hypothetical protein AUG51_05535 [Acidobacteria bacterium 13_1_20CM_3_53_8]